MVLDAMFLLVALLFRLIGEGAADVPRPRGECRRQPPDVTNNRFPDRIRSPRFLPRPSTPSSTASNGSGPVARQHHAQAWYRAAGQEAARGFAGRSCGASGVSVILSFVITMPVYALILVTIAETTMLVPGRSAILAMPRTPAAACWSLWKRCSRGNPARRPVRQAVGTRPLAIRHLIERDRQRERHPAGNAQKHAESYVDQLEDSPPETVRREKLYHACEERGPARTTITPQIPNRRHGEEAWSTSSPSRAPLFTPGDAAAPRSRPQSPLRASDQVVLSDADARVS